MDEKSPYGAASNDGRSRIGTTRKLKKTSQIFKAPIETAAGRIDRARVYRDISARGVIYINLCYRITSKSLYEAREFER